MNRSAPLAGLALGLALTGCGPVNRSVNSVHQPIVSRADYSFDATTAGGNLAPGEEQRLAAWFDTLHLGYGDSIAVDGGDGSAADSQRDAVAAVAARYGLLLADAAPVTGAVPSGTIRVVVTRSRADVPGCPDWRRSSQPELAASTTSNYGCAAGVNLAAMVASPQDLIVGRSASGTSDARSVTKAIKTYRDLAATGAQSLEKTSTGASK